MVAFPVGVASAVLAEPLNTTSLHLVSVTVGAMGLVGLDAFAQWTQPEDRGRHYGLTGFLAAYAATGLMAAQMLTSNLSDRNEHMLASGLMVQTR